MDLVSRIDLAGLKVVKFPAPVLLSPSAEVEQFGDELAALAERMLEIMYASHGVGLAAPQLGLPIRLFVFNPAGRPEEAGACVNPHFVDRDGAAVAEEGCLSLPGVTCKIKRYAQVTVRGQDVTGRAIELVGEGLRARVFQHEMDHLDGTLLVDRMSPVARLANRRALKDLQDQYAEHAG